MYSQAHVLYLGSESLTRFFEKEFCLVIRELMTYFQNRNMLA